MKVYLKSWPVVPPDELAAWAAELCYDGGNPERALRGAMGSNHLSVTEHATFTFGVEGVSRALLAQMTRHRIASFSVQSQRYVRLHGFEYVIPPSIEGLGEDAVAEYKAQMDAEYEWYCRWIERLEKAGYRGEAANQDARYVLPNASCTKFAVSMNVRELLHFFELRCCNRAQWEIRQLAWAMLEECNRVAPVLFGKAGPGCVRGRCPEGKRACGEPYGRRE